MRYIKAEYVLPQELLELIQQYIDGDYIYIPRKSSNRKCWGETTESKKHTQLRNTEIYAGYLKGLSTTDLANLYFLSVKSIQRIILDEKRKN